MPSPSRAPKQKIRSFAYNDDDDDDDDEDEFDAPRHPTRNQTSRGYQADGFVVDDADDDGFAPIRVAKPARATKAKGLGAPITADERTAELTEFQTDVLRDFMTGAKKLRKSIQDRKDHREAIFTDTVLREMGLDLPQNLDEMKTISGVRPEMVDLYGKQFLVLINNTRIFYGDDTPIPRNPQLRNRPTQSSRVVYNVDDDDDDDEVDDQNHRLVVDLCSEEEDETPVAVAEESGDDSFYGDFDDDDDDDDEEVHTSHHFTQNPDVADFNSRYTELGGGAAPSTTKASKTTRGGARASGSGYKKKASFRKRPSGGFNKNFGGVKKRAPKGAGNRASGGAAAARNPAGGGDRSGGAAGGGAGGSWGSIMAMPT